MANSKNPHFVSQTEEHTPEQFAKRISAFVADVRVVTTVSTSEEEKSGRRQKFPGFILTDVIRKKIQECWKVLSEGNVEEAWDLLMAVEQHFTCQQAGYAKRLTADLQKELNWMIENRWHPGIIDRVNRFNIDFLKLVTQGHFDLDEASRKYWAAIDTLEWAEQENKKQEERKRNMAEDAKKQEALKAAETSRLQEERRQKKEDALREEKRKHCAKIADELSLVIGSI